MKGSTKRTRANKQKIKERLYHQNEAITLVKEISNANFTESIEAHISLWINPKYSDQQLRSTLILPHNVGKSKRIAILMPASSISTEYEELADIVGSDDLIEQIEQGQVNFDVLISTPDMMPKLVKLGRILGPKNLMPSPKAGTVTTNIKLTLEEFKAGKIEYRTDKTGIVHLVLGKSTFTVSQLLENLNAVYLSLNNSKPSGVKGRYFKSFHICSTMSPSIKIDISTLKG
uniref:Large ribosomal subunit protein uL1c n=1 Tax=Ishige okamurae TaxID=233772 RepID=A0A8E5XRG9_9PHAE|nr:ribosomal protein L1 [Ishige okamurae]QVJ99667.1 ribosomal protein L1 [Ishige okamurae]WAM63963.1 50S ribosomal protein L1 [Ishige okamurae]